MPTNTYVALDTKTLGTAVPTVTFTSIPQGYTDLVLVAQPAISSGNDNMRIRVGNGSVDTGSNYSWTALTGNGTRALSDRASNQTSILSDYDAYMQTTLGNNTKIIHFQNYSNTTTFKTILSRSSNAPVGTDALVNTWRSTAAINTITLFLNGGAANFVVGSTFTLYGIAATPGAKATGGYITSDSQYIYHTFLSNGTFTPTQALTADILVVAGGGGGAGARVSVHYAGGGGAGGVLGFASQALTATPYSVTVGGGGAGGTGSFSVAYNGTQGGNSQFASLTASVGGGYGATAANNGGAGGSGGGGGSYNATTSGGAATSGQGFAGGGSTTNYYSGGGGGAGAVGANGTGTTGSGYGGAGTNTVTNLGSLSTFLSPTGIGVNGYIAGGGQGSATSVLVSALGGGGIAGADSGGSGGIPAVAGVAYTGSGGGAGSPNGTQNGAAGGSGIVIIRYAK